MAVTIQASIGAGDYEHGQVQRKVYYDETANKWWAIYSDGGDIFFENSTDGTTWANATAVNTDAGATCVMPSLCGNGTYLYIFWEDAGSGDDGIHFRRVTLSDSTLYPASDDGLVVDVGEGREFKGLDDLFRAFAEPPQREFSDLAHDRRCDYGKGG